MKGALQSKRLARLRQVSGTVGRSLNFRTGLALATKKVTKCARNLVRSSLLSLLEMFGVSAGVRRPFGEGARFPKAPIAYRIKRYCDVRFTAL